MGTRTEPLTAPPPGIGPAQLHEKAGLKRVLLGPALPTAHLVHERLGKIAALAIFSSDALSSVAYASEEMLKTLFIAGFGAVAFSLVMPLTLAITCVLAILIFSYRQTIKAYPSAGGAYIVTKDNFGLLPAQVAGVALLTDYVLTVAVSVSAGVAAIIAAAPGLHVFRVPMAVVFICLIALGNLRGVRESGKIFAAPTYLFILSVVSLIVIGLVRLATGSLEPGGAIATGKQSLGLLAGVPLFIALHALASGSAAMTGVEAISNGVPAFKAPEWRNAQKTLTAMGLILASMFIGISFLASRLHTAPDFTGKSTVLADIGKDVFGQTGIGYLAFLVLQVATTLILVLAANTAFADFPRLASILSRDGFMPRQFQFRGDRLAFSVGIMALGVLAGILIVVFEGSVTNLIPLYTVGVFVAFTLSQSGMVRHWWLLRGEEPGWRWRASLNGAGAVATGVVAIVVGVAKFALGAWMVLLLIPLLMGLMAAIHGHYRSTERSLAFTEPPETLPEREPRVVVPVSRFDRAAVAALAYARAISADVTAVHVATDREAVADMRARWEAWGGPVKLVILESPYRALMAPLLAYLDATETMDPSRPTTVVLAEFVPRHLWEYPLHNQTALRLKLRLFRRPNTVVIDVPYHLTPAANDRAA
jgi:amino acid transporter